MRTLIATVLAFAAAAASASAVEVDGIAAKVGTATILKSDVVAEMRRRGIQDEARYDEVRNRLIERELILKASSMSKMTMQDWVVEDRVRQIVDDVFGGDFNRLKESLARERLTYGDWRRRIKEDLIVNAMRWNTVDKNVRATPAAMRAEYDAHPEKYRADSRVTVSVMLLKPDDRGKRDEVDGAIRDKGFAEAARAYSADGHAKDGGLWKDVRPEDVFKPEICAEIAKTPQGSLTGWIDLDGWSFLLRKESESGDRVRTLEEAYEDVEASVRASEAKRLYEAWMERLKADTYIHVY